jgi:MFS family permease
MTLSIFAVCVSWGGTFGLVVIYATRALHLGHSDARLGLLYSAGELGGLIAALIIPKIVKRPSAGRVAAAFMLINVMSLLLLAVAPGYAWAVALFFCYEFTYTMILTVGITLRQMLTPDHMQGRINTTARLIGYSGQPLGALISGLLAGIWPIRVVFALMTLGVAAGAALAGWSCRRSGPLSVISLSPDR